MSDTVQSKALCIACAAPLPAAAKKWLLAATGG